MLHEARLPRRIIASYVSMNRWFNLHEEMFQFSSHSSISKGSEKRGGIFYKTLTSKCSRKIETRVFERHRSSVLQAAYRLTGNCLLSSIGTKQAWWQPYEQ